MNLRALLLCLAACTTHDYEGPTPLEPLPPDPRLGDVLVEGFAGRGSHFLVGDAPGGQVIADLRPAGFELDGRSLQWRDAESRLAWLADGAHATSPLPGELPLDTQMLGTSLIPKAAIALVRDLVDESTNNYEVYVVQDGITRIVTLPEGWGGAATPQRLVLGPHGDVFYGQDEAAVVCPPDGSSCVPLNVGTAIVPFTWDDTGILVSWNRVATEAGNELCVGYAVASGWPEPIDCITLSPWQSFAVPTAWQDPAHAQIPVWVQTLDNVTGVQVFTWSAGGLSAGDLFNNQCPALVAPMGTQIHLRDDQLGYTYCPDPRSSVRVSPLQTVADGVSTARDLHQSWSWLACECTRASDPTCPCFQRWPATPQLYASQDAASVRYFVFEPSLDGMTRLYARTVPLPSDVEPFDDTPCTRTCGDGACALTEILSESCAPWNPYFGHDDFPPALVTWQIECNEPDHTEIFCANWGGYPTWTLTPADADGGDEEMSGSGMGGNILLRAGSAWTLHVEKDGGFSSYTVPFVAPDVIQTLDLGTINLYRVVTPP